MFSTRLKRGYEIIMERHPLKLTISPGSFARAIIICCLLSIAPVTNGKAEADRNDPLDIRLEQVRGGGCLRGQFQLNIIVQAGFVRKVENLDLGLSQSKPYELTTDEDRQLRDAVQRLNTDDQTVIAKLESYCRKYLVISGRDLVSWTSGTKINDTILEVQRIMLELGEKSGPLCPVMPVKRDC